MKSNRFAYLLRQRREKYTAQRERQTLFVEGPLSAKEAKRTRSKLIHPSKGAERQVK